MANQAPSTGAPLDASSILSFKINGVTPFLSWKDVSHECLTQSCAILAMLEAGEATAAEVTGPIEHLGTINPMTKAGTYGGIQKLIALAAFALEQEDPNTMYFGHD